MFNKSRRLFLSGSASLISTAALAAISGTMTPQIGGGIDNNFDGGIIGGVSSGVTPPTYFFSAAGSDANNGRTVNTPKQTLAAFNALTLLPGDTVSFRGGDTFAGTATIPSSGSILAPVTITSYGVGNATIAPAANTVGITSIDKSYVTVSNLSVTNSGTTAANAIWLFASTVACQNLIVQNCTVTGSADSGIFISASATAGASINNPQILYCTANGCCTGAISFNAGIRITGGSGQQNAGANYNCTNLVIRGCSANNNLGANGTSSWCGSGIQIQRTNGFLVELNNASGNGGLCNNTAGPTGIWGGMISNGVFQDNISRTTGTAGADGGGYDIDGGCDHVIMQRNISIGNAGYGFLIFPYDDVKFSSNNNNILRYNISYNDTAGALRLTSGGTTAGSGQIYGNKFHVVNAATCIKLEPGSAPITYTIANNDITSAHAGTTDMISTTSNPSSCLFFGNNYYTPNTFRITWNGVTYASVALWRAAFPTQETIAGADTSHSLVGTYISASGTPFIRGTNALSAAETMRPDESSPLLNVGVDLFTNFGINPGSTDYFGSTLSTAGPWSIGPACMKSALKSIVFSTTGAGAIPIPADFAALYAVDCIPAGGSGNGLSAGAGGGSFARGGFAAGGLTAIVPSWVPGTTTVPCFIGAAVATSDGQETVFGATSLAAAIALGPSAAVGADPGKTNSASVGGLGGLAANSVGTLKYDGGSGGLNNAFVSGGGGAAGAFGPGAKSGDGTTVTGRGASGGGGANGGLSGLTSSAATTGGTGGVGPALNGGGAAGTTGPGGASSGGGSGGGGASSNGGSGGGGGNGSDWSANGSGGGGGGGVGTFTAVATGGLFGGGGGGRNNNLGGQGGIRLLYKTAASL